MGRLIRQGNTVVQSWGSRDSYGRGSFDTSTRFVAGDPGAKFGASAPLEYETTGDVGHPHWGGDL